MNAFSLSLIQAELIPSDDLIKPGQPIEFSPEEFEQLLEIQQDLMDNMIVEEQSDGKHSIQPWNILET